MPNAAESELSRTLSSVPSKSKLSCTLHAHHLAARPPTTMNSQDAFRRLAQQIQRASGGGGGPRMPSKGFFTGSGLLLALMGGGIALNASMFNGTSVCMITTYNC